MPGIVICIAITVIAIALQAVEVRFVGEAYLEALVLAILIGVAVRTGVAAARGLLFPVSDFAPSSCSNARWSCWGLR